MNVSEPVRRLAPVLALVALATCRPAPEAAAPPAPEAAAAEALPAPSADAHVVEVLAEDYAFEAPAEIPSGWTTFRMSNAGEEVHFLYLTRLPEGRTYDEYVESVGVPVNRAWRQLREGEIDVQTAFEQLGREIPAWYWTEAEAFGGPGLARSGGASQVTVELEPGTYVMECFMKTPEGEFHWVEGMIRPLEVRTERSSATEPSADATITITADGFDVPEELRAGATLVRVDFVEQPEAGFGNDVHVARLGPGQDGEDLVPWMDAFHREGLVNPAPAPFLGGTHERRAGRRIYFTVDLEPGRYAWIAEAPEMRPLVEEFTVR